MQRNAVRRGGYLYVAVLFTSLIVGASVATALSLETTRLKSMNAQADRGSAIRLAEGEIHRLAVQLNEDPTWRQNERHAALSDWRTVDSDGPALVRYQILDTDGDLGDDNLDDVQIVAHASYGSARAAVSANLEAGFAALDLLRYGVTATDDIRVEDGALLVCEGAVQVHDDCKSFTSGAIVCERLECANRIEFTVRGDIEPSSSVETPGGEIIDRYVAAGTEIPFASLPNDGLIGVRKVVLSSSVNPMGPTDPNGIYWIDCGGQSIWIGESRINATLAIRNTPFIMISGGLLWESPGAMLVTEAPVIFNGYNSVLDEATTGVNFNPATQPYLDSFDAALDDRYSSQMRGILYSRDNVTIFSSVDRIPIHLTGVIVARDLALYTHLNVHSAPELLESVPFGFVDPDPLRFISGSHRRVPLP
ncbi:MAG: hypothetical protein AAFU85_06915 [Planctomycetota bacterium]